MPTEMSDMPWLTLEADLFTNLSFSGGLFLKVCENCTAVTHKVETVAVHLKSMFSRHGICNYLRSDNGPQFAASLKALR